MYCISSRLLDEMATRAHGTRAREVNILEKTVTRSNVQKSNSRFQVSTDEDGKPRIKLDLFHQTIPCLAGITIEFEVMGGTTLQQAKALAESINDKIIGIVVTQT